MRSFQAYSIINDGDSTIYYEAIDGIKCPICNTMHNSDIKYGIYNNDIMFVFSYCTNCKKAYISEYHYNKYNGYGYDYILKDYIKSYPNNLKECVFDECINNISKRFIKIYNQSLTAELMGLDEMYGIGYRKALEFLIKDYLINKNPENSESIAKKHLNDAIEMFPDENAKKMANACRILVNDNTHYLETFSKDDLCDIKSFVDYVASFISNEQKYLNVINKKSN